MLPTVLDPSRPPPSPNTFSWDRARALLDALDADLDATPRSLWLEAPECWPSPSALQAWRRDVPGFASRYADVMAARAEHYTLESVRVVDDEPAAAKAAVRLKARGMASAALDPSRFGASGRAAAGAPDGAVGDEAALLLPMAELRRLALAGRAGDDARLVGGEEGRSGSDLARTHQVPDHNAVQNTRENHDVKTHGSDQAGVAASACAIDDSAVDPFSPGPVEGGTLSEWRELAEPVAFEQRPEPGRQRAPSTGSPGEPRSRGAFGRWLGGRQGYGGGGPAPGDTED